MTIKGSCRISGESDDLFVGAMQLPRIVENRAVLMANRRATPPMADTIDPFAPLRLDIAAKIAFPDGSMTASGLRRESARGRLALERIANKDYTTLEAIRIMRELCRVQAKESGFTSASRDTETEKSWHKPFGSSRTALDISPQDALRARLKRSRLEEPNKR